MQEATKPQCELMAKQIFTKKPQFSLGDRVVAVGPSNTYRGKQGVVTEIIATAGNFVYRYAVRFTDGTTSTFFGFELQLV
jgi:hypothetical protein